MITISGLHVKFGEHQVFQNAHFSAVAGAVTVLCGASGAGKTTLINALLFRFPCAYYYDNKDLSSLSDEEKSRFLSQKVSVVEQTPLFIENLRIREHIEFYCSLYRLQSRQLKLQKQLGVDTFQDKFPAQLSGGEKTRAALYLALLKQPQILLLDEPTAALDQKDKQGVIDLLKRYAKQRQAVIIIATHEHSIMEIGDTLYQIEQGQCHCVRTSSHENVPLQITPVGFDEQCFFSVGKRIHRNLRPRQKLLKLVIGVMVGVLTFSYSMNNVSIAQHTQQIQQMGIREIIAYQPIAEGFDFSFNGSEYPVEEESLKKLAQCGDIERIVPRFDVEVSAWSLAVDQAEKENAQSDEAQRALQKRVSECVAYDRDAITSRVSVPEAVDAVGASESSKAQEETQIDHLYFHTYMDDYDYSSMVESVYHDEGVYVSPRLFEALYSQTPADPYLEFSMMIPLYDSDGIAQVSDERGEASDANVPSCTYERVRLPIRGVLKNSWLGQEESFDYQLYVPYQTFLPYVEKQQTRKQYTIYWDGSAQRYSETPPEKIVGIEQTIVNTRWKPNAYSIVVDDLAHLDRLVSQLKNSGFQVESRYVNTKAILLAEEGLANTMTVVSLLLLAAMLIPSLAIQYLKRHVSLREERLLKVLGLNQRQRRRFFLGQCLLQWRIQGVVAVIVFFVCRLCAAGLHIAYVRITPQAVLMLAALTFLCTCLFPMMMRRGNLHAGTKERQDCI